LKPKSVSKVPAIFGKKIPQVVPADFNTSLNISQNASLNDLMDHQGKESAITIVANDAAVMLDKDERFPTRIEEYVDKNIKHIEML